MGAPIRDEVPDGLSAVVLAAGRSRRMGARNKLLLPYAGRPIVQHVVRVVQAAPVAEVVVVTGYDAGAVRAAVEEEASGAGAAVRVAHNDRHAEGMGTSIVCGVAAASPRATGYAVCLGDMPLLTTGTLALLCARFNAAPRPAIVQAAVGGRPGHPVLFDGAYRAALCALTGDDGARSVLHAHAQAVLRVPVRDEGAVRDVDTPEAYDALGRGGEPKGGGDDAG